MGHGCIANSPTGVQSHCNFRDVTGGQDVATEGDPTTYKLSFSPIDVGVGELFVDETGRRLGLSVDGAEFNFPSGPEIIKVQKISFLTR